MSESSPQEYWIQNQEALEELAWAIDSAAGTFALLLARCNYDSLRHQLVAELQQRVPGLQVLTLPPDTTTLFATLRDHLGGTHPPALMILGLESVTALDPLLASANQVREEFRKHFPFPLVFWVTDEVLQRLTRLAPDFESWATTTDFTFDIVTLTRSLQEGAEHLFETVLTRDSTLSFKRLLRQLSFGKLRLVELDAALGELRQRGKVLPPDIQASLEFFQGVMNPDRLAAIAAFRRSLAFWEAERQAPSQPTSTSQISPDLKAALLHFHVGQYLYYQVYRDNARSTDWELTRQSLAQAIALFEQANRPDLVAKCAIHLQRALERTEDWAALEALTQRSLDLYKTYGSLSRLIQSYRHLAVAAMQRQDWAKAYEFAQLAWDRLAEEPDDQHWQGLYLLTRAQALLGLGDRTQAIALLEEAHHLGDQGHPLVYTEILEQLRQLYRSQQRYLDAFRLKQERQSIEQQYGIRAFVGAGRLQPKREDREALVEPLAIASTSEEIALEIRASGRQKDLEQLLERLGRNDFKLIVIHGYSGVGKSSLVNAGLVTALQQKSIGLRRNLPIVLRTYTNWEQELGRSLEEATEGWGGDRPADDALNLLRWIDAQNWRSVLVFDQFEEFFFVYPRPEARRSFFRFLTTCLQILSVKVVLSLREDYLHFLLECNQLPEMESTGIDILGKNVRYGLGNFAPADAATIIESLTERAQFYLEPELQEELVTDLAGELGQVRPIELQIVGAQLQAENITTLAAYRQLGENPKQMLVEHYLAEVVDDCGEEHSRLAELVLYLLTDEKGTRPLKTRKDLERELQGLSKDLNLTSLDLVLQVFVESGLVMLLPEVPEDRYQLVHDYLAAFVREQQEPRLTALMAELEEEREQRQLAEAKRQETLAELGQVQQTLEQAQQNLEVVNQTAHQREKTAKRREQIGVGVLVTTLGLSALTGALAIAKQAEVQQGTRLELAGVVALRTTEGNSPFAGLLEAMRAGISLQKIVRDGRDLDQYPAFSPLLALRTTLDRLQESTQLKGHEDRLINASFSSDGKTIVTVSNDKTARVWNLKGNQVAVLKGHESGVNNANFSPDGKMIVTASADKTARVWDLKGNQVAVLKGHEDYVSNARFRLDGKMIVTASADKTARVWDLKGNQVAVLKGHEDRIWNANFSPDGKMIVTASWDKTARVWDLKGNQVAALKGHEDRVWNANFSPDGKMIVTASADKAARVWDLEGNPIAALKGHEGSVRNASFSSDGKMILTVSNDKTARVWDLKGNQVAVLKGHEDRIWNANFSPDGKMIVTASWDKTARVWDLKGNQVAVLKGHEGFVMNANFSLDGKTIVTASWDKTARVWDLEGNSIAALKGHEDSVINANFSPDSKAIVTASWDKTAQVWDLKGNPIAALKGHEDSVWNASFSPDGKTIVTASWDKTARVWDLKGNQVAALKGHESSLNSANFSPDSKTIVTTSADKAVWVWDLKGNQVTMLKGHEDSVNNASFSPNGKTIVTASSDKTARVWDLKGNLIAVLKGHEDSVNNASFSPNGKTIVTVSNDKTARVWDLKGNLIAVLKGHEDSVNNASFSPNGKTIVTASSDKTARVWDLKGNLIAVLKGHEDSVNNASFNPDGKTIVTASGDKAARVWDLKGNQVAVLKGHESGVSNASFSPDGRMIVTASDDKTARVWPVQDLNQLLERGCNWLHDYLSTTPDSVDDLRHFCGVKRSTIDNTKS